MIYWEITALLLSNYPSQLKHATISIRSKIPFIFHKTRQQRTCKRRERRGLRVDSKDSEQRIRARRGMKTPCTIMQRGKQDTAI